MAEAGLSICGCSGTSSPYHPTVLTIMLGMNDGRYVNHKPADDDTYYAGFKHIVESVRQAVPNLRITRD